MASDQAQAAEAMDSEQAVIEEPSGLSTRRIRLRATPDTRGIYAHFGEYEVTSAFQPIYSIAHRRPVGFEGLLRAYTAQGVAVPPGKVFGSAISDAETVVLDSLCWSLHAQNFLSMADEVSWLFLNISPATAIQKDRYGNYLGKLSRQFGLASHRVVIEILEDAVADKGALAEAVAFFKELGCLVAIDDFGAGHSNFDRIWHLAPDIVKLDRSVISQAARNRTVERILPSLVNLIHEAGCLTLIEGVETEVEALMAIDSGIDFVQGYYFGRPTQNPFSSSTSGSVIGPLCEKFKEFADQKRASKRLGLAQYMSEVMQAGRLIESGFPFEKACAKLVQNPRVERCFLLDQTGMQLSRNLEPRPNLGREQARFLPIADAAGANWSRRPYFQRAIAAPGEIQCTRPYLSVTGARICITLSLAIWDSEQMKVLCCDLVCDDNSCA